ncbi:RNA-directed DNA polymerase from mobile element jockey [Nephila pilipes]|uniref:RNA-directed DNA polymerase from mobile element jockey n=1 Tax=Nephila pilipes TaxID=299642 RepID=A0A8X6PX22_NEPPI|nr:RNA-directed DNA polymerase from mobile element jockey [Nephila pilipes]
MTGDFNAKHRSWNQGKPPNMAGTKIYNFAQIYDLKLITPTEITRPACRRNETNSIIDFGIAKGLENITVAVQEELSSDHYPLLFNLQLTNFSPPNKNVYKFTNWYKFQEILHSTIEGNPTITDIADLDAAVVNFVEKIKNTIDQSSTTKLIPHAPLPLPQPIRKLIQNKNRLRKRWQELRDPNMKKELNKMQKNIQSILKNFKQAKINSELKEANTYDCSLHRIRIILTLQSIDLTDPSTPIKEETTRMHHKSSWIYSNLISPPPYPFHHSISLSTIFIFLLKSPLTDGAQQEEAVCLNPFHYSTNGKHPRPHHLTHPLERGVSTSSP